MTKPRLTDAKIKRVVRSALAGAQEAGIVMGFDVKPDGTIRFRPVEPEPSTEEPERW